MRAIDISCTGEAAAYIDSNTLLRTTLNHWIPNVGTELDVQAVEQQLVERFLAIINEMPQAPDIRTFAQNKDEPLLAYFIRAQALLRQTGGREGTPTSPLNVLERHHMTTIVQTQVPR